MIALQEREERRWMARYILQKDLPRAKRNFRKMLNLAASNKRFHGKH
jgi:hypothetical protein